MSLLLHHVEEHFGKIFFPIAQPGHRAHLLEHIAEEVIFGGGNFGLDGLSCRRFMVRFMVSAKDVPAATAAAAAAGGADNDEDVAAVAPGVADASGGGAVAAASLNSFTNVSNCCCNSGYVIYPFVNPNFLSLSYFFSPCNAVPTELSNSPNKSAIPR